jgi:DNA primase
MFETHMLEFDMLLNDINNPNLRGLLLNEDIKIYDEDKLRLMLIMMLVNFYTKKLEQIKYSDVANKIKQIRKIQENILRLKNGELVPFNLN